MSLKNRFTRVLMLLLALTLTACGSLPKLQPDAAQLQASLREPCPPLDPPTGGSRAEVLRWIVETSAMYYECKSKHARTVEAWPR